VALYPNGFKITLRIILQNVKQFKKLKGSPSAVVSFFRSRVGQPSEAAFLMVGTEADPTFLDRINRINKILIFHFQFPEETENTQSPSANKIGTHSIIIKQVGLSRYRTSAAIR